MQPQIVNLLIFSLNLRYPFCFIDLDILLFNVIILVYSNTISIFNNHNMRKFIYFNHHHFQFHLDTIMFFYLFILFLLQLFYFLYVFIRSIHLKMFIIVFHHLQCVKMISRNPKFHLA